MPGLPLLNERGGETFVGVGLGQAFLASGDQLLETGVGEAPRTAEGAEAATDRGDLLRQHVQPSQPPLIPAPGVDEPVGQLEAAQPSDVVQQRAARQAVRRTLVRRSNRKNRGVHGVRPCKVVGEEEVFEASNDVALFNKMESKARASRRLALWEDFV